MALLSFEGAGIAGVSACVPVRRRRTSELADLLPGDQLSKTSETIGIREARIAAETTCASDLCAAAARRLLDDGGLGREGIDVLIFLSQTPDHRIPATAPELQHRLGLSKRTACFDMNLACSGYVYGLSTAYAYASQPGIRGVLLLVGETFSKVVSLRDKVNAPLYGDAGTATLIRRDPRFGRSHFALGSDGAGAPALRIPAGGCRLPSSAETLVEREREDGNRRSDHHLYMDAMEVFNFAMREVAPNVRELLAHAGAPLESVDRLVFHQANRFMTDFIARKLHVPLEKVPYCLDRYGNTSSSSIPLTISSELHGLSRGPSRRLLLSGFGAGLSWGSCLVDLAGATILPVAEEG